MKSKWLKYFLLGVLCFILSQPLTRIPILGLLSKNFLFSKLNIEYPLVLGFFIALSAGVFEECSRFVFRRFLLKGSNKLNEAISFGLGHGISEALILFLPALSIISISNSQLFLALLERIIAIIFHIGMTIIIWEGFIRGKEYRNLLIAIFSHGLIDFTIPLSKYLGFSISILYGLWIIADIVLLIYIVKIKKYFGGSSHEKL